MRRSLIVEVVLDTVLRTALVFSLFLLFTGHNAPGGGFVGGLVAGTALVLRHATQGEPGVRDLLPAAPSRVLALGMSAALLTGLGGALWGGEFLESTLLSAEVPLLGTVKTTTALFFDIGVYLVVVGLVLAVLTTLGGEE